MDNERRKALAKENRNYAGILMGNTRHDHLHYVSISFETSKLDTITHDKILEVYPSYDHYIINNGNLGFDLGFKIEEEAMMFKLHYG